MHGDIPPSVQDFTFSLAELHEVSISPFLQPVQVPPDGSKTVWCISHSSKFCRQQTWRGCTLPLIQIMNRTRPRINPWGTPLATGLQLVFWHWSELSEPGCSKNFQFTSAPTHLAYALSASLWESLGSQCQMPQSHTELKEDHCSHFIYHASFFHQRSSSSWSSMVSLFSKIFKGM